jgi:6-phosphofructokinase 1
VDDPGHEYVPSAGEALARLTNETLGLRARTERVGSWARMSMSLVSEVDLAEAGALGVAAVQALQRDETAVMVALRRLPGATYACEIQTIPVTDVANRVRTLPDGYIQDDGRGVNLTFASYAYPLLGPNPVPPYARL